MNNKTDKPNLFERGVARALWWVFKPVVMFFYDLLMAIANAGRKK